MELEINTNGNKGQKGYTAKRQSSDFIEFIRRRLIVAKELLSQDGTIMVRQGYNFSHCIKLVLDEVFGKSNFVNEIVVNRGKQRLGGSKKYSTATDTLFFYSASENYTFNPFKRLRYLGEAKGTNMLMKGDRKPPQRTFFDPEGKEVVLLPPANSHWKFIQPKIDELYLKGVMYLAKSQKGLNSGIRKIEKNGTLTPVDYVPSFEFDEDKTIDANWTDISGYDTTTGYPTENSESLLERVIRTATNENDLVLDFFGGSGTTAAVAEKLRRKWIICDIGKFSFYTMQRRLLQIENSRNLVEKNKKYAKQARTFITINTGLYDLEKLNSLSQEKYTKFVLDLFEVEPKRIKINGVSFNGERKDGYNVLVWNFWQNTRAQVDETFLEDLHRVVGGRIGARAYIIAPANAVAFVGDYHEIDDVKYYFLKIPYQIIRELHREQFAMFRQPKSKNNVNDLDDAVGFHFMRQPDVESRYENGNLHISRFFASFRDKDKDEQNFKNFEALSMLVLDETYNDKEFVMTSFYFADELKRDESDEIVVPLKNYGAKAVVVYVDIYGNEFKQEIKTN